MEKQRSIKIRWRKEPENRVTFFKLACTNIFLNRIFKSHPLARPPPLCRPTPANSGAVIDLSMAAVGQRAGTAAAGCAGEKLEPNKGFP
jgi:hypothetical protein